MFVRIVSVILGLIVVALAFVYFAPGYNMYTVRSESMTPSINMGDMIITGPVGSPFGGGINQGTIITFILGDELVTHRVLSIENGIIITKGDANEDPDPVPVTAESIQGVMFFKMPYIGYLAGFIRTKLGLVCNYSDSGGNTCRVFN